MFRILLGPQRLGALYRQGNAFLVDNLLFVVDQDDLDRRGSQIDSEVQLVSPLIYSSVRRIASLIRSSAH